VLRFIWRNTRRFFYLRAAAGIAIEFRPLAISERIEKQILYRQKKYRNHFAILLRLYAFCLQALLQ
jgi:hypothetical protein